MKKCLPILLCLFISLQAFSQSLIISEFRQRGPMGALDEYVELYNNSDAAITVAGTGYSLVTSAGTVLFTIPIGTVIPARGHYLATNSAYSIAAYPAGNGTTATGNITLSADMPQNIGIALFNNNSVFTLATRLDAVGATTEANTLFKEGTGYNPLTAFSIDCTFYRKSETGYPLDLNNNATDFRFGDTNGTTAGAGQFLGAPGPENLSSPIYIKTANNLAFTLADPLLSSAVNFTRSFTSDPANNSTFGTIRVRFKVVNNTGAPITKLRIRLDSVNTFPAPAGTADLRIRDATAQSIGSDNYRATTLEQPPAQPNGGGDNSSISVTGISTGTPLAPGATAYFTLLFGLQQTGNIKMYLHTESLPAAGGPGLLVMGTDIALPINLSKFSMQNVNCAAKLSWTTLSEINSSRFAIEHSNDLINFKEIASVPAAGFSNVEKNYSYNATLTPGRNYYRLQMIDVDGSHKYSDILTADGSCAPSKVTVFPNPVKDVFTVNGLSGSGRLLLTDITGKAIQSLIYSAPVAQVLIKTLPAGTYFLLVQSNAGTQTIKIVKE